MKRRRSGETPSPPKKATSPRKQRKTEEKSKKRKAKVVDDGVAGVMKKNATGSPPKFPTGSLKPIKWKEVVGGPHFAVDGNTLEKKEGGGFGAWDSGSLSVDTFERDSESRGVTWISHVSTCDSFSKFVTLTVLYSHVEKQQDIFYWTR
jgi:hypothetical protein